ncbi:hypothetical protein Tco_0390367, partial [Tanacetum coccineum]
GWNDPIFLEEGSLNYKNANIEQLLGVMECQVDTLKKDAISLMGKSGDLCGLTRNTIRQLPLEPSHQEEFKGLITNFIIDQEEKVRQLEEYICIIGSDFMQLSSEVVEKLKEEIGVKKNKCTKIKKIMRYPDTKDLDPLNGYKFSEALTEKASFHTPKFVSPKSLFVKYVRTIFLSPPLVRESTFGFKPGTNNNRNVKSRYDAENSIPQSSPQVLLSFKVYTPPMTYPKEVEETIGIPMEVEPLDHMELEDLGLNTCSHDLFLTSRKISCVGEPEPQPLPKFLPLDVNLGDKGGTGPPINPYSLGNFRLKVVDQLTIHIPPLPHVASFHPKDTYCYYHPCISDPKKHYGFKPALGWLLEEIHVTWDNLEKKQTRLRLYSKSLKEYAYSA